MDHHPHRLCAGERWHDGVIDRGPRVHEQVDGLDRIDGRLGCTESQLAVHILHQAIDAAHAVEPDGDGPFAGERAPAIRSGLRSPVPDPGGFFADPAVTQVDRHRLWKFESSVALDGIAGSTKCERVIAPRSSPRRLGPNGVEICLAGRATKGDRAGTICAGRQVEPRRRWLIGDRADCHGAAQLNLVSVLEVFRVGVGWHERDRRGGCT